MIKKQLTNGGINYSKGAIPRGLELINCKMNKYIKNENLQ